MPLLECPTTSRCYIALGTPSWWALVSIAGDGIWSLPQLTMTGRVRLHFWQFPPSKEFSGIDYPKPGAVALDSFDTMIMVLDLEAGTLAYMVNNIYLGTAFSGLRGPLYPIISCTWGDAEISLIYR